MAISSATAVYGLNCTGAFADTDLQSGTVQIGPSQTGVALTTGTIGYGVKAELTTNGNTLTLDVQTNTASGTSYVAGTAQVETATVVAAGGCTSNGNCSLTFTSAAVTGSPLTVIVALTTAAHTTATLIATALAAGLAANAAIAAVWTVTSNAADIIFTRKNDANGYKYANEAGTNLAIPSGLGITAAPTSANTTAGVVTSGTTITVGGDVKDFRGAALTSITTLQGLLIDVASGSGTATNGTQTFLLPYFYQSLTGTTGTMLTADLVITSTAAKTLLNITAIGK